MLKALLALVGSLLRKGTLVEVASLGCLTYGAFLAWGAAAAWVTVGAGGLLFVAARDADSS